MTNHILANISDVNTLKEISKFSNISNDIFSNNNNNLETLRNVKHFHQDTRIFLFFKQFRERVCIFNPLSRMLETRGWLQTRSPRVSKDTQNRNLPRQI